MAELLCSLGLKTNNLAHIRATRAASQELSIHTESQKHIYSCSQSIETVSNTILTGMLRVYLFGGLYIYVYVYIFRERKLLVAVG